MYGALTQKKISEIDCFSIILKNIKILGFTFNKWIKDKSLVGKLLIMNKIGKLIKNNLSTEIHKTFALSDIKAAIA